VDEDLDLSALVTRLLEFADSIGLAAQSVSRATSGPRWRWARRKFVGRLADAWHDAHGWPQPGNRQVFRNFVVVCLRPLDPPATQGIDDVIRWVLREGDPVEPQGTYLAGQPQPSSAELEIVAAFERLGIDRAELERFVGRRLGHASVPDLNALRDIASGIERGETTWAAEVERRHG
jgi:hypothetical protein